MTTCYCCHRNILSSYSTAHSPTFLKHSRAATRPPSTEAVCCPPPLRRRGCPAARTVKSRWKRHILRFARKTLRHNSLSPPFPQFFSPLSRPPNMIRLPPPPSACAWNPQATRESMSAFDDDHRSSPLVRKKDGVAKQQRLAKKKQNARGEQ